MYLSRSVTIYIPEETQGCCVHTTANFLTNLCGGATVTNSVGYWKDSNNNIVKDNIWLVKSFCKISEYSEIKKKVREFAYKVGAALNQEAISIEWHDFMEILEIPQKPLDNAATAA